MLSQEEKQTLIQMHYHNPPLRKAIDPLRAYSVENPSCGDRVSVEVQDFEGKLLWFFDAEGCTLSQSAASIMASMLNELSPVRAREMVRLVMGVFRGEEPRVRMEEIGPMQVFEEILDKPVRMKCILLPWRTAEKALSLWEKSKKHEQ
jgi:nitrogen fixation NifU-like protein